MTLTLPPRSRTPRIRRLSYLRIAIIAQLSLSAVTVQSLDRDVEFANKIKATLPTDPNIGPYIANLQDATLPREEDVQLYLEPYSLHDDLVLRHGLVYIPNDDELKLQVLRSCPI